MKSYIIPVAFLLTFCYSCNSGTDNNTGETDTTFTSIDSADLMNNGEAIWTMAYDSILKKDRMVKLREVNSDTLTAEKLVAILNATWDEVHIDLIKIAHDTIFIKIPDSNVLTAEMGTTGSNYYMSSVIYTLTELQGIRSVNFDFIEGDHAVPGTYVRFGDGVMP